MLLRSRRSHRHLIFFFFKQKTAYEMRISDWSSDVCSSDLVKALAIARAEELGRKAEALQALRRTLLELAERCHGDDRPDCPIIERMSGDADDVISNMWSFWVTNNVGERVGLRCRNQGGTSQPATAGPFVCETGSAKSEPVQRVQPTDAIS